MPPPALLGTPVYSSRLFTTALVPNTLTGGWDFIVQSYESPENVPTEWIVINLDTASVQITTGANGVYAGSNFEVPSVNTFITENNQLRASNGRVYFPMRYGNIGTNLDDQHYLNVAYFDPTDRQIHQLPSIHDTGGYRHSATFSAAFNPAGTTLYMGSQAVVGDLPFVFKVDPITAAMTFLASVGAAASTNPKYAFYLAADAGPGAQWLYVAVGQDPWELCKINVNTGAMTVLYTTTGPGTQFIEFENRIGLGWSVHIIDNGVGARYWLADGAATDPYPGAGAPAGGARTVTPYANTLVAPPELDWSRGIGQILWRPFGSSGGFNEIDYSVAYRAGVKIESLTLLADGSLLGNAEQYNGFFRRQPGGTSVWYGAWPLGLSQPVVLSLSSTLVYLCGYPNGALYSYDPSQAWDPLSNNPRLLGNFHATSDMKYCYFLELGANGRLYAAGRRERDSTGSALGYYVGAAFTGQNAAPLTNYLARGFVVMDSISRVVFSGETLNAADARLLVYDLNLAAVTSYAVLAGMKNTGLLFETSDPAIVMGLVNDSPYYLYRFNIQTGALLTITTLSGAPGATLQEASGTVLAMIGNKLNRINPETLAVTELQDLTGATLLAGGSTTVFFAATATLNKVIFGGLGHLSPAPRDPLPPSSGHLNKAP